MIQLLPGMTQSIAYVLAAVSGIVATWYIFKKVVPWIQAYQTRQQAAAMEESRRQAQQANQQANSDADALAQREKEHDGG